MRKLFVAAIAMTTLVAGCVVYDDAPRHARSPYGDVDRDHVPNRVDRDRDGDGVRDRYDRRPDDPRRY
jgi:hypothetical protein